MSIAHHPLATSPHATAGRLTSVLGFTIIYAACFTLIKAGLAYAPPLWYGGLRALIGGLALLALALLRREALVPARGSWPALLALAATSTTITFGGMFLSPGRTGAGIASVLGNTQPLFAVLLAALVLREPLTRGKLLALALGLAGVSLITVPLSGAAGFDTAGVGLALAASAGAAAGSVIVKRMRPRALLATAGWQLVLGSLPLLGASARVERAARVVWTPAFAGMLLFLALVGTSFTTALWYWLIERTEVGRLTLFLFLTPVVGLAIAAAVFAERVTLLESAGIAVTLGGIGAVVWEDWHAARIRPTRPKGARD